MSDYELEIVEVKEECCGTDACQHTSIQHSDHMGWLVDGRLRCRTTDAEQLFECALGWDDNLQCELVGLLDGHVHGPECGHELVPHGNHHDYLVGSRLHHVVGLPERCCERGCLEEVVKSMVVDHGHVHVRHRSNNRVVTPVAEIQMVEDVARTDIFAAGICCPSEVPVIHKILRGLPGVISVDVAVMTKNVHVEHDPSLVSPAVLVSALNGAGLQASLGKRDRQSGGTLATLPFNVILSGIFLLISIASFFASAIEWLKFVALLGVIVGCPLIVIRAVASLRRWILDINVLMLVASLGAIALQEFHEAAAIVFLFGVSQWLEDRCMGKAREAVSGLRELQPEFATSAVSNEAIPVEKIEIGDLLLVRPGDRVPVDGEVISGVSALDESLLTGESSAVAKEAGSTVLSGSINSGNGSLKIRAASRVKDSTVAQLAVKVEQAAMQQSETERSVETFAKFYTPTVVIVAATTAVLPLMVTHLDWSTWLKTSLVLLVTACPCALVISTPVTTVCGVSRAAQKSILIKGGSTLETLGLLKAITFDKTGTLTEGNFEVVQIKTYSDMTEDEVLNWAASVESHSSHPLAAAIVGSAAARGQNNRTARVVVDNIEGFGLMGTRDGTPVGVGNLKLMRYQECPLTVHPEIPDLEKYHGERGQKVCFVSVDKRLVGALIVADRIRSDAHRALDDLRSMKLHLGLLTGDGPAAADYVASTVGIHGSLVMSGLIPEQKASILEDFRHRFGRTAHVGDGINDSLALATADVGIAMGIGGSTMAVEAADVALFSNDITSIAEAIRISRRVRSIIRQNILFSISVKVVVIGMAFVSNVPLWGAVLADVGSALVVIANGLRLLGIKRLKQFGVDGCHREQVNSEIVVKIGDGTCCSNKTVETSQRSCCSRIIETSELKSSKKCCSKQCCSETKSVGREKQKTDAPSVPSVSKKSCSKNCCSGKSTS